MQSAEKKKKTFCFGGEARKLYCTLCSGKILSAHL